MAAGAAGAKREEGGAVKGLRIAAGNGWMGTVGPPHELKKGTEACPRALLAGEGAVAGAALVPVALGRMRSGDAKSKGGREKGWWESAGALGGRGEGRGVGSER